MNPEIKNPEAESYELLQKYGDSIQNYLKDSMSWKKIPGADFTLKESGDEIQKLIDSSQDVIIDSLKYDEKANIFNFNVGRAKISIEGEAADIIKQGYKSEKI